MSASINKKELEHLAELARIELDPKEEKKLLADLDEILNYFGELQKLSTDDVPPMTGGTDLVNVLRPDSADEGVGGRENTNRGAGVDAFPESKDGYNKVPPVFE